jgi:hypothetical protein
MAQQRAAWHDGVAGLAFPFSAAAAVPVALTAVIMGTVDCLCVARLAVGQGASGASHGRSNPCHVCACRGDTGAPHILSALAGVRGLHLRPCLHMRMIFGDYVPLSTCCAPWLCISQPCAGPRKCSTLPCPALPSPPLPCLCRLAGGPPCPLPPTLGLPNDYAIDARCTSQGPLSRSG